MKGRSTAPFWSREASSPSSALVTWVTGGFRPTTSCFRIAALAALPVTSSYSSRLMTSMASGSSRNLTRLGIRRMTWPSAVCAEGGLVDGPVGADETLVGPVEFAAGVVAVRLGPALVLRLQDAAGAVAEAHQGGQALAGERAVGGERRAAVGDRHGSAVDRLADGAIVADEETALRDVLDGRRGREGGRCGRFLDGTRGRRRRLRQAADRVPELLGQVAVGGDAVALAVERVLAGPGAKHHLRVVQEVAVDRNLDALDGKRCGLQPVRIGVVGRLRRGPLAQEQDVRDDGGSLALEGVGGQADRAEEVGPLGEVFADGGVLLVQREVRGHHGENAAGLQGVHRLGDEVIVEGEALPVDAPSSRRRRGRCRSPRQGRGSFVSRKFSMRMSARDAVPGRCGRRCRPARRR